MLLKKVWKEDLLNLVLLLSLLRIDRNADWRHAAPLIDVGAHDRSTLVTWSRNIYDYDISPKNYDSMLSNYERWVFHDLNLLGRYSTVFQNEDVTAYMGLTPTDPSGSLSEPTTSEPSERLVDLDDFINFEDVDFSPSELGSPRDWSQEFPHLNADEDEDDRQDSGSELSQEDMELIEVLWKQDVDMGFSVEEFQEAAALAAADQALGGGESAVKPSQPCFLKQEQPVTPGPSAADKRPPHANLPIKEEKEDDADPWSGLSYTIDLETGEYILKQECDSPAPDDRNSEPPSGLLEDQFSLEEALQLVGINDELPDTDDDEDVSASSPVAQPADGTEDPPLPSQLSLDDQLTIIQDMLQTPSPAAYYHRAIQGYGPGPVSSGGYGTSGIAVPFSSLPHSARSSYHGHRSSQEQRWQDLANLLGAQPAQEYPHPHPHPHSYHTNHYPPPSHSATSNSAKITLPDNNNLYATMGGGVGGSGVGGSGVNLMANSSEPLPNEPSATTFKMENPNDMLYYQNGTDAGHNSDGFINSILNEDDLLIDMAMNEGMYTMRMLEGGIGAADSDSAVSSMGSERVPSLASDTDWMESNSDSGHTPADHFMAVTADQHSKRWYEYAYYRQHSADQAASASGHRMPPVAQKKYHMFGKRLFHDQQQPSGTSSGPQLPAGTGGSAAGVGGSSGGGDVDDRRPSDKFNYNSVNVATPASHSQATPVYDHPASPLDMVKQQSPEVKFSCSPEFSRQNLCGSVRSSPTEAAVHNHTYHLPPEHLGTLQRPLTRDKRDSSESEELEDLCLGKRSSTEDLSISRDERRAHALNIPITVCDIINLPMDEFNERLSKYDLSETQLSLIRDIRRRGKNKVAAQNCRKRKLDQIMSLADEVKAVREKKQRLLHERDLLLQERMRVKNTVAQLFRHVFQSMRDEEGNCLSPQDWSLDQGADGSIQLVPRVESEARQRSGVRIVNNDPERANISTAADLQQPSTSKKHHDTRKHVP